MLLSELAGKSSLILVCSLLACGSTAKRMNCAENPEETHEVISAGITNSWHDLTVCID